MHYDKHSKSISSAQETQYDIELNRKAKESYRAFAEKVAEASSSSNIVLSYPIHWQYGSSPVSKKAEEPKH